MTCAPSHLIPEKDVGGRPREYDREKIAQDLIIWAKKENSINFCKFCANYDPMIPPPYLSIWAKEDKWFSKAFEIAKAFLGARREELLSSEALHVKAYDLNAATYDYFLKEEKIEHAKYLASLSDSNKPSNGTVNLYINGDLASGLNLSTPPISEKDNSCPK